MPVPAASSRPRSEVVADGAGMVGHGGGALLSELPHRLGLTSQLGRRANRAVRAGGAGHRVDATVAGPYSLLQAIEQNFGLPLPGMRAALSR